MKPIIWIILFLQLLTVAGRAQGGTFVHIDSLPPNGLLLKDGWKLMPGDDIQWAQPGLDDRHWLPVNPTVDIHQVPQLWNNNIVWFRLHFYIDSTIDQSLAMVIQQVGASEFYLDGQLIHRFGKISTNPVLIKASTPLGKPVSLAAERGSSHVLAVRYALEPGIRYSTHWGTSNKALHIEVHTVETANGSTLLLNLGNMALAMKISAFFILFVLFFTFFLSYPKQKVNLIFSLYALFQVICWATFLYYNNDSAVAQYYWANNFLLALQVIGSYFIIIAIYRLFDQNLGRVFYSIVSFGLICILFGVFVYDWGWLLFGVGFTNMVNIEITRIALGAALRRKKGAWIIAAGGVFCFLFWLLFSLGAMGIIPNTLIFFDLSIISIPVAVAIYIGYDFALTYQSLASKYNEVKMLSAEKQSILATQKEELEEQVRNRTVQLEQSLIELQSAQTQLVQKEKMASLGELTAGIAHEIQNPLNFINNFSDINAELLDELHAEAMSGNIKEVLALASDIRQNEAKIVHHGQRADAIVKSMLQHSRASNNRKEPTNLNALAEEYLRLSYHGLRAKDKNFNVNLETHFDEQVGNVPLFPQDLSRVLLNLFNNAFYAVNERKKLLNGVFEPTVSVHTRKQGNLVVITVADNGTGMSPKVAEKVFQPFFTTKPSGAGTGLGLSLSYDIITKGHGGEIRVETEEGAGSVFVITIPTT